MNTKKIIISSVTAAILASTTLASAGDIEANVALSTDYVFRGFSQTNEDPAISGGFDYSFDNGFSVGTWASNVNFGEGTNTSTELDFYAGYGFEVSEGVTVDLSYIYFAYPGETDGFNYSEFVASVSFSALSLGLVYSPDYFGSDDSAIILNADYSVGLAENLGLDLHIGYSDVDADDFFDAGESSYIDYSAALTTSAAGVDFALTYYGTDLDDIDAADDRIVLSVGKAF
ncbi:MAG: hypothetical protein ACJA2E_000228 [Arenicella sp.]|jgi:uncharacterized protein (TIGR02001 family)